MGIFAADLPKITVLLIVAAEITGDDTGRDARCAHHYDKTLSIVFAKTLFTAEHEIIDAVVIVV